MLDFSIIIPAYRAEKFIKRSVDSALAQDGVTTEVIVVDDASPDATAQVVENGYGALANLQLIRLAENGGPSVARNAALRMAKGEWVAILDADDAFEPGRLKIIKAFAESEPADIVADNISYYDAMSGRLGAPRLTRSAAQRITPHAFVDGARPGTGEMDLGLLKPAFRRQFLIDTRLKYPPDIRHGEDFVLMFRALLAGASFWLLPEVGYHWTTRGSGWSQTPLDYERQVRDTEALKAYPGVAEDRHLLELLHQRQSALSTFARERELERAVKAREVGTISAQMIRHPSVGFKVLARGLRRKLGQRRTRE